MFAGLSLNRKLLVLEIVSFAMLVLIAAFCLIQLKSTLNDDTENLKRLHADIDAMGHIESMNIAFLKEVKLAKDVWIRGADPEKLKKYRAEYVEQAEQFEKQRKLASSTLQELAQEHSGFEDFIKTLDSLATEHQNVSGKYLGQIDAHLSTADSDAKVAGIDRAVTKQITELRNGFATFIETKSSEKIELAESGYQQRRNIVIIAVLAALGTSLFLGSLIIRSVSRQLGGDPEEVAQVLHIMASGDFSMTALQILRDMLMRRFGKDMWTRFSSQNMAHSVGLPALIIHDRDDRDIPWQEGEAVARAWPHARFLRTEGLGHRRILRDPDVIDRVVRFLVQEDTGNAAMTYV